MSCSRTRGARFIAVATLFATRAVRGDDPWTDVGVTAEVGGGVTGGTGKGLHDAGAGLLWTARLAIGSRRSFALELDYLGTADGTLSTSVAEATWRVQPWPRGMWSPYAFAGVGWRHTALVAASMTIAEPGVADESLAVPFGAGVQLRDPHGLVVDVRGAFHAGASDAWEASTVLGLEF
jgi:hypothetical protein